MTLFASLFSVILFLLIVFIITDSVIAAQTTTTLSPACGIDPSDTSRKILEITGLNYASTIFNIISPVDNCHLYIHDLVVSSINITSPIINNSNITIRNVTSSNKSITTFILFSNPITDFSFINFSNISHSSLSIDSSTGNDVISIVKFDKSITGRSDMTSSISISGLQMNNVVCDRTASFSTGCTAVTVYFGSDMSNVASLKIASVDNSNIAMNSSSSDLSFFASIQFDGALHEIPQLSISKFILRNIQMRNSAGPCQLMALNFASTVDASSQETAITEFEISDFVAENATSFAGQGNSDLRLVSVNGAVSNFTNMSFSNVIVSAWGAMSASGTSNVLVFRFGSSIAAPATDSLTTLTLDNVRLDEVSSSGTLVSQIVLLVVNDVTNFHTIQIRKLVASSVNSTSTTAGSAIHLLYFTRSITAPVSSMASSSLLLLDDMRLESVSSSGKLSSELYFFSVAYGVDNYYSIKITNLVSAWVNSTSLSENSKLGFLFVGGAITAPIIVSTSSSSPSPSPSSILLLDNIHFENVSSIGKNGQTEATFVNFFDALLNFGSVQFSRLSALSVNSNSASEDSTVLFLVVGSSITAPEVVSASSPPSSLVLESIRLENAFSYGYKSSLLWCFSVGGAVTDYKTVHIKNLSATSLNSTSFNGYSQLDVLEFGSSITAPDVAVGDAPSSLVIDGILVQNASSICQTWMTLYFVHVSGRVGGFTSIQITNLTGISLRSTTASDVAILYFLAFDSPIEAPVAVSPSTTSSSSSSTSLVISNIRIRNVVCDGFKNSNLALLTVVGTLRYYFTIAITNFFTSNILSTAPQSLSTTCAVCFGGLANCNSFELENIEMKNISALTTSTSSPSTIALLSIASGTHNNISKISLRNSKIEQVSISSGYKGLVRLFDAGTGMHVEKIVIENNTMLLFSSSPNRAMSSPPTVSICIVGLALIAPGFLKMEVTNNILMILDPTWLQICSPANCSIVRVSDVRQGSSNNNNLSSVAITGNKMSSIKSSFISFADYYDIGMSSPLINFALEDNKADFTHPASSLLGFDSPPPSSSFPSLVFVDVKCNQWGHAVDRAYEQRLLSIVSSFSELHAFINWTCHTSSCSDTASESSSATSSTSQSPTEISSITPSLSIMRTSISSIHSDSRSSDITASRSLSQIKTNSKSSDASMSISASSSHSPIVPPPPYRSPLRVIYQTATTTTSLLSVLSISSASVFGAVRSRSALRHFNAILYGNCGLDEESLSSQEEEAADASSSPTTMKLRDGGRLTGLVIGNFLVVICIGVFWFVGRLIIREEKEEKRDASEKRKKEKEEKETFVERLIASNAHQMMVLFTILLLEPTLTASATPFLAGIVVEGRSITAFSVVCVLVAWFLILVLGLTVPMWKLVYSRSTRHDEFEESKNEEQETSCCHKLPIRRFVKYMTDPSGEWIFLGEKKKQSIQFELAVPFLEAFTPKFPKFIAIDLGIIVCLSFAEIIGYIIGSAEGKTACFVRGTVVCFAFALHLLCVIYYYKLYTDRMSNTLGLAVEILSITIVAGAMSVNQNDVAEIDGWSSVAVAQSMIESLLMILEVAAVMLPMWDWMLKKINLGEPKSDVGLPDIMTGIRNNNNNEKPRDVVMDARNRKNDARCKMLDQELEFLEASLLPTRGIESKKLEKRGGAKFSVNSREKKRGEKRPGTHSQQQHFEV